ncbi:MAG: hypothetical protein HOQ04_07630 [Pseudarthrobacter sp.]|nr:hypothetical protein [Pseudarthrobacter sp.]NUS36319.1 hypothetical protein [Pseudarthrobacter sp.]
MDSNPEYEYVTIPVDNRPRQQAKELKKLAKAGWEVVAIRPGTMFANLSATPQALCRRVIS